MSERAELTEARNQPYGVPSLSHCPLVKRFEPQLTNTMIALPQQSGSPVGCAQRMPHQRTIRANKSIS